MRRDSSATRLLSAALCAALLLSSFGPQAAAAAAQEIAARVSAPPSLPAAPVLLPSAATGLSPSLAAPALAPAAAPPLTAAQAPALAAPLAALPAAAAPSAVPAASAAPSPAAVPAVASAPRSVGAAAELSERFARPLALPKADAAARLGSAYDASRAPSSGSSDESMPVAEDASVSRGAFPGLSRPASEPAPPRSERQERSVRFPLVLTAASAVGWAAFKTAGYAALSVAFAHAAGAALLTTTGLAAYAIADAAAFGATMLRGRGTTDEQFRAFVRREVMEGRLDPNAAALLKPYRPQGRFSDLTFAFAARGSIWIRPELIASPLFFRLTLVHELSHWKAAPTRGPPVRGVRRLLSTFLSETRARAAEFRGPGALKALTIPALERAMRQAQISLKLARPYEILVVNPDAQELSDPALYDGLSGGAAKVTSLSDAAPAQALGAAAGKEYQAVVLGRPAALLPAADTKDALRLESALRQLDSLYVLATRLVARGDSFAPGSADARAYEELAAKAGRLRAAGSPAKAMASFEQEVRRLWRRIAAAKLKGVEAADLVDGLYGGLRDRGTAFLSFGPDDRGIATWERLLRYWQAEEGGQFRVTRVDLEDGGHILMLRKVEARVGLWLRPLAGGSIATSVPRANDSEEGRAAARASLSAAGYGDQLALFDSLDVSVRHVFGADVGRQELYITVPRRHAAAIRKYVNARAESAIGSSRADFQPHLMDSSRLQDVPPFWQAGITGRDGRIMWIDTGADATHEDFAGRLDVIDMVNEGPEDWVGHGTHVAGISISGDASFLGMAKAAAGIMAKVFSRDGQGASDGEIMGSAAVAQQKGMDVISLSLGSRGGSSDNLAEFFSHLTHQKNSNGEYPIVSASAGNSGPFDRTLSQPAAGADVLAVAAAAKSLDDGRPEIAFYSSVGPDVDRRYAVKRFRFKPEIAGIGGDVTTKPGSSNVYENGVYSAKSKDSARSASDLADGRHTGMSGTSMSNPAVAAIALLVKLAMKAFGAMTPFVAENLPFAVKAVLMRSAKDMGEPVWFKGVGLVQGGAALKLVLEAGGRASGARLKRLFGAPSAAAEGWGWIERLKAVSDAEDRAFLEAQIPQDPAAPAPGVEEEPETEPHGSEEEPPEDAERQERAAAGNAAQNEAVKRFNAARDREAPALIAALKDPVWLVRQRAAFALMNLRAPSAALALADAGLTDPDSRVRQMALLALAEMPTHSVDVMLKTATADPRWDVGVYAAYALARRGDRAGASRIVAEMANADKGARFSSAWLAGQLGVQAESAAAEALSARVKDRAERGNVRHVAAAALFNLADSAPEAFSDRVVVDLLDASGPENFALTRTIAKVFPAALNDRDFVARLRRDPLKAIVTDFVLKNKSALQKPGALAELVQLLARAANVPLDAPTSVPDPSGAGVPGVDAALGPLDLIVTPPPGAPLSIDAATLARYESAVAELPSAGALWLSVPEHKLYALTLALQARGFSVSAALPEYPLARGLGPPAGTALDLSADEPVLPDGADLSLVSVRAAGGVSEARVMAALELIAVRARGRGPTVISLTLGAPTGRRTALSALVDRLVAGGVGVVVGAGNAGPALGTASSPGDSKLAVVVAAASREKGLQFYSARGTPESPRVTWADLVEQLDPGRPAAADASAAALGTGAAAERSAEKLARLAADMSAAFAAKGRALPPGWFPFLTALVASTVTAMPAHGAHEVGAGLFDDEARARAALDARLADLDAVEKDAAALAAAAEGPKPR